MFYHIFETTLFWLLGYLLYHWFLRKETFFQLNRFYLLATLIGGLLLPLFELSVGQLSSVVPEQMAYTLEVVIQSAQPIAVNLEAIEVTANSISYSDETYGFWNIIGIIYWLGAAFFAIRLLIGLLKIKLLYRKSKVKQEMGFLLIQTPHQHLPFSFFHFLFWSNNCPIEDVDKAKIFQHEQAHIQQWHSLDVLLLEVMNIFFWCSPLIYFYKTALRSVHEYLADAAVLKHNSTKQYGKLLLQQSINGPSLVLANHFFTSQLKNRIIMMTKHKSQRKALLKYTLALPLLLLIAFVFSTTHLAAQQTDKVFKVVDEMPRFPGCEDKAVEQMDKTKCANNKLLEFIFGKLKYPEQARKAGIQGMVVLKFLVDKEGNIQSPTIKKAIGGGCDEEVLRVAQLMPQWIPGKHGGKAVNVEFTLPVKFKIDDNDKGNTTKKDKAAAKDEKPLKVAEQMPIFPGCTEGDSYQERWACGTEQLIKFISENIKYPEDAKKAGVEGKVVIQFVVTKEGRMAEPKIIRSIGSGTDEEVLRVFNLMAAIAESWTPGRQSGQDVAVQFNLPVQFKLNEKDKKDLQISPREALTLRQYAAAPNPTSGNLEVQFGAEAAPLTFELLDISGKVIEKRDLNTFNGQFQEVFDLSKAAKGTVIVKITQGGKLYFNKVLVQ